MSDAVIRSIGNEDGVWYFDAVLDNDMQPLFNGQRNETLKWLDQHPEAHCFSVCVGRTMHLISVPDYIKGE